MNTNIILFTYQYYNCKDNLPYYKREDFTAKLSLNTRIYPKDDVLIHRRQQCFLHSFWSYYVVALRLGCIPWVADLKTPIYMHAYLTPHGSLSPDVITWRYFVR
jgi:hypothetical protein